MQQTLQSLKLEQIGNHFVKKKAFASTSLILGGFSFASFFLFSTMLCGSPFFSPQHTNSFSMYGQAIGTIGTVFAGGLFGLNAIGFSIMPGAIKTAQLSKFHRTLTRPYTFVVPVIMTLVSLEMFDRFNLFSAMPLCLGLGFLVTMTYQKSRALQVPLWMSKQISRFSVGGIITLLFAGYCMLSREMNTSEARVVFNNI